MSTSRMTLPLKEEDVNLLKKEAERQGRTFSGYIQRVLSKHIELSEVRQPKKVKKLKTLKLRRK